MIGWRKEIEGCCWFRKNETWQQHKDEDEGAHQIQVFLRENLFGSSSSEKLRHNIK